MARSPRVAAKSSGRLRRTLALVKISARTLESAAWYAVAFLVTQILHEVAHAAMGLVLGRGPILHTAYVDYARDGAVGARVACAAAGPLFSAVQGLVLLGVARSALLRGQPVARLFVVWLSFHGLTNFVGYVFSTSFAAGGDLGQIAAWLELPLVASLAATALGYLGLRLLARPLGRCFAELAPAPLDDSAAARAWSREVGLFAGALATPVLVIAALPVPHWLSLVYVVAAFLPLFDLPKALDASRAAATRSALPAARPALAWTVYVALVVGARLALDDGIPRVIASAGS